MLPPLSPIDFQRIRSGDPIAVADALEVIYSAVSQGAQTDAFGRRGPWVDKTWVASDFFTTGVGNVWDVPEPSSSLAAFPRIPISYSMDRDTMTMVVNVSQTDLTVGGFGCFALLVKLPDGYKTFGVNAAGDRYRTHIGAASIYNDGATRAGYIINALPGADHVIIGKSDGTTLVAGLVNVTAQISMQVRLGN